MLDSIGYYDSENTRRILIEILDWSEIALVAIGKQ